MADFAPAITTIAIAGVGNLGKYFCEEILQSSTFAPIVLSRKQNTWLEEKKIVVHRISGYTKDEVLPILEASKAVALISMLNPPPNQYVPIHTELLEACRNSKYCKRFIPSEWAGNITDFPHLPRFYGTSRAPFREMLASQIEVEWTVVNQGWLMEYFLEAGQTYMPAIPDEFPIDPNGVKACIRGTGDELQSWTSARDVGKAVIALLLSDRPWERETYVCGEWGTFNEALQIFQDVTKTCLHVAHKDFQMVMDKTASGYELACVEEWMIKGASAVPKATVLRQRKVIFNGVNFRTLKDFLVEAQSGAFI